MVSSRRSYYLWRPGSTEFGDNQISLHSSQHSSGLLCQDYRDPEHHSNKEYPYDHCLSEALLFAQMLLKDQPKLGINQGNFKSLSSKITTSNLLKSN